MANVLRVTYVGTTYSDVRAYDPALWTNPVSGETVYYRVYYRLDVPNSYGSLGALGHHPIEPDIGNCPFQYEYEIGPNGDGSMIMYVNSSAGRYGLTLQKSTAYRFEWALTRQSAATTYKMQQRIYNSAGTLVADNNNFLNTASPAHSIAQDNPNITITDTDRCMTRMTLGTNGPSGWDAAVNNDIFAYFGGMAVSKSGWIGPYVAGEHP
jgi:hypothetical protein